MKTILILFLLLVALFFFLALAIVIYLVVQHNQFISLRNRIDEAHHAIDMYLMQRFDQLSKLSAPARRALERHGITTLQQLSTFSEKEILQFHGIGPASLPKLRASLEESGYSFKKITRRIHCVSSGFVFIFIHSEIERV